MPQSRLPARTRLLAMAIASFLFAPAAFAQTAPKTQLWLDVATHDMAGMPEMGGMGRAAAGLFGGTGGQNHYGATRFGAMVRIIFPIAVPGILSAGIFAFTLSWNEFIYALIFLSSPEQKTVPVGVVSELIRGDIYFWGQLMAGALLGSIPVALVYSFFVEYYVTGLTGSVKG